MLKQMANLRGVSILGKTTQQLLKGGDSIGGELGGGSGTCAVLIPQGSLSGSGTPVSYIADATHSVNGNTILVGISKATVNEFLGLSGVHWCCASCASAAWIPR